MLTSGRSFSLGLSRTSYSTSTLVEGLMAMPASMSLSWMYLMSSRGLVLSSEVSSGLSAAVESAAS